ncbi:hypothetical protein C9374_004130 [Naegleria lovaniensis]|uniref:Uncharacterized protein n=1 Tax=Naegleria lovaniensis TaxID=51637 RepID=A0AA88GM19_NAELO|nr:uncharacterized protein C9374_004130 [Naegleria lovaniensis]KAG2383459.1 hypothetical protein C9374_004130 [Naegleria lovaniensis]
MSQFALLLEDEVNESEIISSRKHQRSKQKSKKKSLFREEFSRIAYDPVIWFHVLTFIEFKYLYPLCARIDKLRCEMIYSRAMGHHVLMYEFKTILNGEEEHDTRVWFQKFVRRESMMDLLHREDPQCHFKELREFVKIYSDDKRSEQQKHSSQQQLLPSKEKNYTPEHVHEFTIFVKLFLSLLKRRNQIQLFNMKIRMRYQQVATNEGSRDYSKNFHMLNETKHDEDRKEDIHKSHVNNLDQNLRKQLHCDHFENVVRMVGSKTMISQCKACGISMDISHVTPKNLNYKYKY